jgi:hypothetical protein
MNRWSLTSYLLAAIVVGAFVALAAGWSLASRPDSPGLEGSASAEGDALIVQGRDPFAIDRAVPTTGRINVDVIDEGGRWSPLQSKDTMDLKAELTHPADGGTYRVVVTTPMRQEPEGRYTTWFGVAFGHAHHGSTGIDTPALPRVAAELAVWGYADVYRDGQLVAAGVPAHMMVVKRDQGTLPGQVFLSVASEKKNLVSVPDGYLNIIWLQATSLATPATHGIDEASGRQSAGALRPAHSVTDLFQYGRRELLGYAVLVITLAGLLLLARRPWPTGPPSPGIRAG